ncbi:cobalt transporter [Streptococcus sp. HMSC061D01]|uniref:energy-coupling factor transporter transmembrane component T family protein n=1 Tax=Streptococcus sp. HMSC061D01 TaxID=1739263 RepID=UPI0008A10FD8|nr:energy-coupling factor transporter transmembrane component T [Streptococcus sp. HMSC061D01]OFL61753.1 cobalt transporter [Streptococcus sp. HMSC061D01]
MNVKKELDPRTVLGIVFIFITLGLAINKPLSSHILLLICNIYLITSKAYRECVLYSVIYIIIAGLMFYIYHIPNTTLALTIVSISYFVQKFVIAVMMIEFLKRKTSMPYVISAMQTMKFPNAVAIPFIVILRYMPTLREDYGYLKDSLKIRGIRTSGIEFFIHPIRSLEFMIVPILFRSIRVAEELSTSVLLRGIENYKNRTNIYPLKFTKIDAVYALFTVIAVSMLCYLQF